VVRQERPPEGASKPCRRCWRQEEGIQRLRRESRDEENVRPNRDLQIERPIQMDFLTNEPNSERRALPCHL